MRILFSDVVLFRSGTEKQLMRSPSIAEKFTLKFFFLGFFFCFVFLLLLLLPCLRKKVPQAKDRNSRRPHIGRAIS